MTIRKIEDYHWHTVQKIQSLFYCFFLIWDSYHLVILSFVGEVNMKKINCNNVRINFTFLCLRLETSLNVTLKYTPREEGAKGKG